MSCLSLVLVTPGGEKPTQPWNGRNNISSFSTQSNNHKFQNGKFVNSSACPFIRSDLTRSGSESLHINLVGAHSKSFTGFFAPIIIYQPGSDITRSATSRTSHCQPIISNVENNVFESLGGRPSAAKMDEFYVIIQTAQETMEPPHCYLRQKSSLRDSVKVPFWAPKKTNSVHLATRVSGSLFWFDFIL